MPSNFLFAFLIEYERIGLIFLNVIKSAGIPLDAKYLL